MKGYLVLENGEIFEGEKIGYEKEACLEVVFNTSMAGYLKVFTDPSYASQGVVMTYPLIGNYGIIPEDTESKKIWVNAIFVHELAEVSSNFRREKELNDYLIENEIPGLKNINTRKLTKILRNSGTMRGKITSDISNVEEIIKEIKESGKVNRVQYRAITGACRLGTEYFCNKHKIQDLEEIDIEELSKILDNNEYGAERFWELIGKEG